MTPLNGECVDLNHTAIQAAVEQVERDMENARCLLVQVNDPEKDPYPFQGQVDLSLLVRAVVSAYLSHIGSSDGGSDA